MKGEVTGADPEPPISGGAKLNNHVHNFWPCPFSQNHTHLIAAKRSNNQKTWRNQWNSSFCPYRQVYQSDFIAKCMSDRGFLARRGVLELAMSIEACMLSWLEGGGCLSTPSTPLYLPLSHILNNIIILTNFNADNSSSFAWRVRDAFSLISTCFTFSLLGR